MNNIFNVRVRRLIKDDLIEYGQHLLGFIGFVALMLLFQFVLYLFFGIGNFFELNININGRDFDLGGPEHSGILRIISFGGLAIAMFILGIVGGAELPSYVRKGVARKEYFTATTTSAIIFSLLVAPVLLGVNAVMSLIIGTSHLFYNALFIGDGDIAVLIIQFLIYIGLFLTGYSIAMIWQRVGWLIGLISGFLIFIIAGFFGWNFGRLFNIIDFITGDERAEISWIASNGIAAFAVIGLIAVFGIAAYTLMRRVAVKVK